MAHWHIAPRQFPFLIGLLVILYAMKVSRTYMGQVIGAVLMINLGDLVAQIGMSLRIKIDDLVAQIGMSLKIMFTSNLAMPSPSVGGCRVSIPIDWAI